MCWRRRTVFAYLTWQHCELRRAGRKESLEAVRLFDRITSARPFLRWRRPKSDVHGSKGGVERTPMTSIKQTTITSDGEFDTVQLHISDVPLEDTSARLRITIAAKLRGMRTPSLAHLQGAAMTAAQDALTVIIRQLTDELNESGYGSVAPPRDRR